MLICPWSNPAAASLPSPKTAWASAQEEDAYRVQGRAGKGIIAMNITEKTGKLVCLKVSEGNRTCDLTLIRDDGVVIRVPVDTISVISRNTQGVRLMKIDEGHRVASVALAPHNDDEPQKGGEESDGEISNANADAGKTAPSDTAENSEYTRKSLR